MKITLSINEKTLARVRKKAEALGITIGTVRDSEWVSLLYDPINPSATADGTDPFRKTRSGFGDNNYEIALSVESAARIE